MGWFFLGVFLVLVVFVLLFIFFFVMDMGGFLFDGIILVEIVFGEVKVVVVFWWFFVLFNVFFYVYVFYYWFVGFCVDVGVDCYVGLDWLCFVCKVECIIVFLGCCCLLCLEDFLWLYFYFIVCWWWILIFLWCSFFLYFLVEEVGINIFLNFKIDMFDIKLWWSWLVFSFILGSCVLIKFFVFYFGSVCMNVIVFIFCVLF